MSKRWTDVARQLQRAALLTALCCAGGCGGYDVGPDPQPYSPPAEPEQKPVSYLVVPQQIPGTAA